MAQDGGKERFRLLLISGGKGTVSQEGQGVRWTMELAPGQSHDLYCLVPSITLTDEAEIAALRKKDFDADSKRICEYWRGLMPAARRSRRRSRRSTISTNPTSGTCWSTATRRSAPTACTPTWARSATASTRTSRA